MVAVGFITDLAGIECQHMAENSMSLNMSPFVVTLCIMKTGDTASRVCPTWQALDV